MQRVVCGDGALTFELPPGWDTEPDVDGSARFVDPTGDLVLLVSILRITPPTENLTTIDAIRAAGSDGFETIEALPDGNAFAIRGQSESATRSWLLCGPGPRPDMRLAIFTCHAERRTASVAQSLATLDREIRRAILRRDP